MPKLLASPLFRRYLRGLQVLLASVSIACLAYTQPAAAMSMQQLFDTVNAQGNYTSPAALQGQTLNMYSGGSLFMRMPKRTYQLSSVTPPSWNAGCGGIDLFMGGFSFINKEQFVAMLRNIGSNALGYGFKLAIQNLCPTCDNVMQALQATAQQINRLNMDSCETAKGLVNAALPDTWTRGRQDAAKNFGVDSNIFENVTDAWTNVMNDENKADDVIDQVKQSNPAAKDVLPTGNVVWKALKKIDGMTDEERMVLMSLVGSMIFPTQGNAQAPKPLMPTDIDVATLIGNGVDGDTINVPIWRCDTTTDDGCLNPYSDQLSTRSFRSMVMTKMNNMVDHIAARSPHDDVSQVIAFLNTTDLPIYAMLAAGTRYNNTQIADSTMGVYIDLIAAKYAETYIRRCTKDLQDAIGKYAALADSSQTQALSDLKPQLERIRNTAHEALMQAYTRTVSTHSLATELAAMQRAVDSNLSETLRSSLAFGKSLN
ncbi:conjugal transfer protein TraH [Burkholderia cenocepacia]|uniref:conjugal transfer protein TraH n=1 Tax=Burkholderia cenocepacia TaxID=95486 RepID=UPI000980EEB5|nr:conjugal transfer protein TraH [Burkholderia cenocepacia]ONX93091.1 conjugal transfer protein TraH [Burkholderia cenocepacia]